MSDAAWVLLFRLVAQAVHGTELAFSEKAQLLKLKAEKHCADDDLEALAALVDEFREAECPSIDRHS